MNFKWVKRILLTITSIAFCGSMLTGISHANWTTSQDVPEPASESYSSQTTAVGPQAYKAGATKVYYDTIPHALKAASSGDIIVVIPAVNDNYHSTSNPASNANIDKKTYTITEDCEIKNGVTLVIPTDTSKISSVINSGTLTDYITSMKEDSHSNGSGYGAYATTNEARFLRVTVTINDGVTLTNNGTLVVSGYLNSGTSSGGLVGNTSHSYSRIILNSGAKIVQKNSSAHTYCFGYISESSINNNSEANFNAGTLHIPFVLIDYRGFSYSWAMTYNSNESMKTYHCSAFNQFEFRNIDALVNIKQGTNVYAYISVYLSYDTQGIDQCFPKTISIVGTNNSFLCQLTDSTYSSISYKYNKTTNVSKIHFYGGMTLNYISLSISASIVTVNLSTNNSYLPLSWRQKIELSKADGQASATFNFNNQMLKVLPGSEIIVNNGATLTGKSLAVYSSFYDGTLGQGLNSKCAYGTASYVYPLKKAGSVIVKTGGALSCSTSIAGTIYADSSSLTLPSTRTITMNEAWVVKASGTYNPAWKIDEYLQLSEELQVLPYSSYSLPKIYVGMNTYKNYNSYLPAVNIKSYDSNNALTTTSLSQYQKVIHLPEISKYKVEFVSNIYLAKKYNTDYAKNEEVTYSDNNSMFCAINSVLSISNDRNGVNEFNVQSVVVTCTTPTVDDKIPLYPGTSVQCVATVDDIEKAYGANIVWSSSDNSIATVDSKGSVTGVQLGTVVISATCDGVVGSLELEVIAEQQLVKIESIYITDSSGNSSKKQAGTDKFGGSTALPYHGAYGNNKTITFTLNITPSDGVYSSILWTFTASDAGRQYMNDKAQKVNTAENVTTVTIHTGSGTGASADRASLVCKVTDLDSDVFTATFYLKHNADTVCVTEDALITTADGTKTKASNIELGDMLKTWSFEKGDWAIEPVIFLEKRIDVEVMVITLSLDNGNSLDISWGQGFFDADLLDYFIIDNDNYFDAIGRRILTFENDIPVKHEIVSTHAEYKTTSTYEIHTGHGFQFVANDILTIEPLINEHVWFTVNEEYKYDEDLMKKDLETYGVLPYELFADYVTEEQYDVFNGKYLAVPIGKGYFTLEELMEIIADFIPNNT